MNLIQQNIKKMANWSLGLLASMNDKNLIIIKSDYAVVIKDKYPKARFHFLVLPFDSIPTIFHLNRTHLQLLMEMDLLAVNAIEISGQRIDNFKIGYHASPSMQRLHLHAISTDFNSPCLKTKHHWNSFNTDYFIKADDLQQRLLEDGKIQKLSEAQTKHLLSTDLKCHLCGFKPKNMPDLKNHLKSHPVNQNK